eukprot:131606-Chlamydomonas_euryale.AAC.1
MNSPSVQAGSSKNYPTLLAWIAAWSCGRARRSAVLWCGVVLMGRLASGWRQPSKLFGFHAPSEIGARRVQTLTFRPSAGSPAYAQGANDSAH